MKMSMRFLGVGVLVVMGVKSIAQDSTRVTRLEDVTVTAQKRAELLQKVPFSISAITSRQVRAYRLWNNKDITGLVPNLYAADPGDGRDVISIRGITTTSYDPAVATYVDGVNQFGLDTYIPTLFDVERIEVLRGPQGTLYGRNAMGGVINVITRQPSNELEAFGELSAGGHGQRRYSAGLRAPLIKGRLFLGVAGLYDARDGYYSNEYNGKDYDRQHGFTGNYYLKWLAGRGWSADLNVKHRAARNHGAFPLLAGGPVAMDRPYVLSQNAVTTMVDNTFNGSVVVRHKGAAVDFLSQTSYQQNYRYYTVPIDGDFSPYDVISISNNYGPRWNKVKAVTEDIRFASPEAGSGRLKWTAGLYGFYQEQPNKQATNYGEQATLFGLGDSLFTTTNTTTSYRAGMAVYGQASYSLTAGLHLTGGLRYDYERQLQHVMGAYQHDGMPSAIVTQADTAGRVSFHALSPKLGLDYSLSGASMAYIVWSRGYRTGGLTQLSSDPSSPPLAGFRPEYSNNYEAGVKSTVAHGSLRFNIAAFYSHINDAQVPTLVLPDAITVTRNTGRLNSYGAEADIAAVVLRGLELDYHFGYTHTRFADLTVSQNGSAVDLAGRHQVFSPDVTSMLAAQYTFGLWSDGWKAVLRGEWKYLGTTYFDLANEIKQTPYSLFNLRAGVAGPGIELMFWGRNVGNKRYVSYAYDFGAYHLGDPRSYGVTLYLTNKLLKRR